MQRGTALDSAQFTLPHREHTPPGRLQDLPVALITGRVALKLSLPVGSVGAGPGYTLRTGRPVQVPKAALHKDYHPPTWQHYVGFARQRSVVQAVAQALSVQVAAHQQFGLGVLAADATHDVAALLGGKTAKFHGFLLGLAAQRPFLCI